MRANHLSELGRWQATTKALMDKAKGLAQAEIASQFGHKWAMLMLKRDAPDFLQQMDALKLEQGAALAMRIVELLLVVRAERNASRGLLVDKQKRERHAMNRRYGEELKALSPAAIVGALGDAAAVQQKTRAAVFNLASRVTTSRALQRLSRPSLPRHNRPPGAKP